MEDAGAWPVVPRLLAEGSLEVEGRLAEASNLTLYGRVVDVQASMSVVYKPVAGERPLWDFPDGTLAAREAAAFLVSEVGGWGLVPPTVLRDGPLGWGMCQAWVEHGHSQPWVSVGPHEAVPPGWLPVGQGQDPDGRPVVLAHADDARLRSLAVLDLVLNNADRKGSHILRLGHGTEATAAPGLAGVDHGVCFHTEDKLRTVLWGWAGSSLSERERSQLKALAEDLGPKQAGRLEGSLRGQLRRLLDEEEVDALEARVWALLRDGVMPLPTPGWPVLPWPAI